MVNRLAYPLLLCLAIIGEGVFTSLPLVLNVLLVWYIRARKEEIFPISFLSGFILDIFLIRRIGEGSLFFVLFLFIVLLYEKKFELQSFLFVLMSSFLGSIAYIWFFRNNLAIEQALVSSFFALTVFSGILYFKREREE